MGPKKLLHDGGLAQDIPSSSARSSSKSFLTVKTPLLPGRSGISMESAKSYGADIEKSALLAADSGNTERHNGLPKSATQPKRRRTLGYLAATGAVCLTTVAVLQGRLTYGSRGNVLEKFRSGGSEELSVRAGNSTLHYGELAPLALSPLPLGSVQALGWLQTEMQSLADGLAGHEMDFYPIVSDSRWLGGNTDYSDLNEGFPYWLNGMVPLAYGLGDDRLKDQVKKSVDYVLSSQDPETGFIGPAHYSDSRDLWSRYPLMLGLKNLAEADPSYTDKILDVMYKFVPNANDLLADGALVANNEDWARSRYADMVLTLEWLFDEHPTYNNTDYRGVLWQMMGRLRDTGIDWAGYYTEQSYFFADLDTVPQDTNDGTEYFPYLHGVNVGQGLKTPAVDYRFTNNASLLDVQKNAVDWTMKYHGAASGTILADEREVGLAPNRGSELCTAVETMFSMHTIYSITGQNEYADHAELAAFNALPVMMTHDSWAHQYLAQPNQPWAAPVAGHQIFWNVGDFGTTYGTAPNYPCCTVNHPQGYPKFTAATYMAVGSDGLAHVLLSPAKASTKLGNGASVQVSANTDYPFSDVLSYSITSDKPFTFYVRVPGWATSPSLTVNGNQVAVTANAASGLAPINIGAGQTSVQFVLKSTFQTVERANDTIAVYRGALLYALDVGQMNTSVPGTADITRNQPPTNDQSVVQALSYYQNASSIALTNRPEQARDYNFSNTMPWNYAIDESSLRFFAYNGSGSGDAVGSSGTVLLEGESLSDDASGKVPQLADPIWDYRAPSQYATAQACEIKWDLYGGAPFRPPLKGDRTCQSDPITVVFRPYGSLNLHMAELPTVSLSSSSATS